MRLYRKRFDALSYYVADGYEYFFVDRQPDLRYIRASVSSPAACQAAHIFAQAAARGDGEAPSYLLADLLKVHVLRWSDILDSAERANRLARKVADAGQNAFELDDLVVRWRCCPPQCGYNAPSTVIEIAPARFNFVVSVTGRPEGVAKRFSPYLRTFVARVETLEMPEPEPLVAA
jgi:hypothetical protein